MIIDVTNPENWYLGRFCESKFFDEKDLTEIRSWIDTQEWVDGIKSLEWNSIGDPHSLKMNQKTKEKIPQSLFWPFVDKNTTFTNFTNPKESKQPMCTKTSVGGYYKPHFDNVCLGHYSTTIFINEPDEYEGGELVLWLDGKEVFFKPKAGMGITYETGIGHRVNTVTKGERLAFVFWSHCSWSNLEEFKKWRYYKFMNNYVHEDPVCDDLKEYFSHPYPNLRLKKDNIARGTL